MQPAPARPPLPKLAWLTAIVAFLSAACMVFAALYGQVFIALPMALIPLLAGIGILRRNIWSARGFGLLQFSGVVLAVLLGVRGDLGPAGRANIIWTALFSALLSALFFWAARSLARVQGTPGSPRLWIALSVLYIIPWLFLEAFRMPSTSMEDALLQGDCVLVQRWPRPVLARGDVVVFQYPLDPRETYIKRVVGLGGDRIRIADKTLYRNGAPVPEPYAKHTATYADAYRDNFPSQPSFPLRPRAQEMLASQVISGELVVPSGKCFVLGDNRDDSDDSRYWGFVDASAVFGKPVFIYNSIDRPGDDALNPQGRGRVRWGRLFQIVR